MCVVCYIYIRRLLVERFAAVYGGELNVVVVDCTYTARISYLSTNFRFISVTPLTSGVVHSEVKQAITFILFLFVNEAKSRFHLNIRAKAFFDVH
jgi:hypothetical protein